MNVSKDLSFHLSSNKALIITTVIALPFTLFALSKLKRFISIIQSLYDNYQQVKAEAQFLRNESISSSCSEILSKETFTKIFDYVKQIIESKVGISHIKHLIASVKNEELLHSWDIFKENEFASFFSSLIIPRYLLFITFTCISLCKNQKDTTCIQEILQSNWALLMKAIDNVEESFNKSITNEAKGLNLKEKQSYSSFEGILNRMYSLIMTIEEDQSDAQLAFHLVYLNEIKEVIDKLEAQDYDPYQKEKMKEIKDSIHFYSVYYDILSSNCFNCLMLTLFNKDFDFIKSLIASKVGVSDKSLPQLILFMDEVRVSMLSYSTSLFTNQVKAEEVFDLYSKIIDKA